MPKAYSYLRFSTTEQEKGHSLERQTAAAEKYAARYGLELDDQLRMQDKGISGWTGANVRRGALGEFLSRIDEGSVETGSILLVENLDRVSRMDPWDALPIFQQIMNAGVTIVTLQDERVWSREEMRANPFRIMESLLSMIRANQESETKARRLRSVWESKRAKALGGKPLTAVAPAWLELDRESGSFRVLEERAEIVRRIFRETLEGAGMDSIAKALNAEGVQVFGRGKRWYGTYVRKILENASVVGTFVPHTAEYKGGKKVRKPQDPIPGYFPAVVDPESFQRVQGLKQTGNAPRRGRHAQSEVRNLFGGLLVCGRCGSTVTRVYKGKPPKGGEYLVCTAAKAGVGCKYNAVRYAQVEGAFLERIGYAIATAPAGNGEEIEQELRNVEAGLFALQDQHENVLSAIQQGGYSPTLDKRLRELDAEHEALQERERDLQARKDEAMGPAVERKLGDLSAALDTVPVDRTKANALLRQCLAGITLDHANGCLWLEWKHGGESSLTFGWPEQQPSEVA